MLALVVVIRSPSGIAPRPRIFMTYEDILPLPSALPPSWTNELEHSARTMQHAFETGGLLLRTFECYHNESRGGLQQLELCAMDELAGEHAPVWEDDAAVRPPSEKQRFIAGNFIRPDLPRTAFPNTFVTWGWGPSVFTASICVGLVLLPPKASIRGHAWPNDAWVSSEAAANKRHKCSDAETNATAYALRRWGFTQRMQPSRLCSEKVFDLEHEDAITCWSDKWEPILQMQAAFWKHVAESASSVRKTVSGGFARGCSYGTVWNQVSFDRKHSTSAIGIFYGNFSSSTTPRWGLVPRHAYRSRTVALHLQQVLSPLKRLAVVQLSADGSIAPQKPIFTPVIRKAGRASAVKVSVEATARKESSSQLSSMNCTDTPKPRLCRWRQRQRQRPLPQLDLVGVPRTANKFQMASKREVPAPSRSTMHSRRVGALAPQCAPLQASLWPGVDLQWRLARSSMGIASATPELVPALATPPVGVCNTVHRDWRVTYAPIFKVNSAKIWENTKRQATRSRRNATMQHFAFTFVREPLSRFASAYGEIANRALTFAKSKYEACSDCYTFLQKLPISPHAAAVAFVNDMLQGCIASPCCKATSAAWWGADLHVMPQVSFLEQAVEQNEISTLQYLGRLERLDVDWAAIGRTVQHWRGFDKSVEVPLVKAPSGCDTHRRDCEAPGKRHRDAMKSLLSASNRTRVAICRILLPDYGCLRGLYELPAECAAVIAPAELEMSCPPRVWEALADGFGNTANASFRVQRRRHWRRQGAGERWGMRQSGHTQ